ncbi:hypothetical protein B0H16DRAFT_1638773 [Mycena metata]|uniref:DUF6534 domain-containing protein n=1 Tax=Mycena metata TaxID=1033252 RepID=A0AAD7E2E1_9AGAR|nr:hypothetical protein B0H16DRAFT_1638773 [Mycena metata]
MSPHSTLDLAMGDPDFGHTFEPVFWGFCVSLMLFGVSVMQAYLYFTRYSDKLWIRLLVGGMVTLDALSMVLIAQTVYYYTLPHFGNPGILDQVTPELTTECLISAILTCASQMYFAYQLFMIRSPGIIPKLANILVVTLAVLGLAGGIACTSVMFVFPRQVLSNRNHTFAVFAGINKGSGAAADIVATIAMCAFLSAADTGLKGTSNMLKTIMHLFVNRGILVTIAQVGLLIVFFATSNHLYWIAFHINGTKLYVNTFLAMLNARNSVKFAGREVSLMTMGTYSGAATRVGPGEKVEDYEGHSPGFGKTTIQITTTSTTAQI